MKFLESMIKCYERKYKRNDRQYTTKQYTINLRKEDVELQAFECEEKVCIIPKIQFQKLVENQEKYSKIIEENRKLTNQLSQLQADYEKLKNEHKHLQEVFKKREKEVSHLQNEVERLQNRSILEII